MLSNKWSYLAQHTHGTILPLAKCIKRNYRDIHMMKERIMKEKNGRKKRQKEKRKFRTPKQPISNQETKKKIDELVALLFESPRTK